MSKYEGVFTQPPVRNIRLYDDEEIRTSVKIPDEAAGTSIYKFCGMTHLLAKKKGTNLHVKKNVTDELIDSKIDDICFDDIRWMFPSIIFTFEDPYVPSAIFTRMDYGYYHTLFNFFESIPDNQLSVISHTKDSDGVSFYYEYNDGTTDEPFAQMVLTKDRFDELFNERSMKKIPQYMQYDMKALFTLCVKVLLYCSIPKYEPKCVGTTGPKNKNRLRREKKQGVTYHPRYEVVYVPTVIKQDSSHDMHGHGSAKKPHRRRGHFRKLHSEKFKNKHGELVYVESCLIHGGSLDNKLYVARKV